MRKILSMAIVVCFILSGMPLTAIAQKKPKRLPIIAVNDLDLKGGVPEDLKIPLSNRVREILISTGKYMVLDRANQLAILDEIGIQQSGLCDAECAVEIGRWLSAEYMVFGTVTKLGPKTCNVTLQSSDIAKANIVSVASHEGGCEPKELLVSVEVAAFAIAGIEMKPAKLVINATPKNASVYVDGDLKGKAPLSVEVMPGRHKVMVTASGHRLEERVINLKPASSLSLDFILLKEKKKWYKAWWFWGAIGVAALGGAIAATSSGGSGGGDGGGQTGPDTGSLVVSW